MGADKEEQRQIAERDAAGERREPERRAGQRKPKRRRQRFYLSDPLVAAHETAVGLHGIGLMDKARQAGISTTPCRKEELKNEINKGLASGDPTPLDIEAIKARGRKKLGTEERFVVVIVHGVEVCGGVKEFNAWLRAPSVALGGKPPLDILISRKGLKTLEDILGRAEQGVCS